MVALRDGSVPEKLRPWQSFDEVVSIASGICRKENDKPRYGFLCEDYVEQIVGIKTPQTKPVEK